jgi:hypothetical protein
LKKSLPISKKKQSGEGKNLFFTNVNILAVRFIGHKRRFVDQKGSI